ncbi:hypothetical protein BC829DRAFT_420376 [Chytridium lagenaria]|nr:hypothetical protein BC829DRAFT_420376 [Chytridium lagenaria]
MYVYKKGLYIPFIHIIILSNLASSIGKEDTQTIKMDSSDLKHHHLPRRRGAFSCTRGCFSLTRLNAVFIMVMVCIAFIIIQILFIPTTTITATNNIIDTNTTTTTTTTNNNNTIVTAVDDSLSTSDIPSNLSILIEPSIPPFAPHSSQSNIENPYTIPRIVHLTVPDKDNLEPSVALNIAAWRTTNPNLTITLYDDADMRNAVVSLSKSKDPLLSFQTLSKFTILSTALLSGPTFGVTSSDVRPVTNVNVWDAAFDDKVRLRGMERGYGIGNLSGTFSVSSSSSDRRKRPQKKKPAAPLIQGFVGMEGFVSSEKERLHHAYTAMVQWCQWTFAFRPRHPFLRHLLLQIINDVTAEKASISAGENVKDPKGWQMGILERTGPGAFTRAVNSWLKMNQGDWMEGSKKLKHLEPKDLVYRYEVVGTVGFMPIWALSLNDFDVKSWVPPGHQDIQATYGREKVLVEHLFKGSWKKNQVT